VAGQAWVAAARIADLGAQALTRARRRLGPLDRKRFARFRSAKRRREFLAARCLLPLVQVTPRGETPVTSPSSGAT